LAPPADRFQRWITCISCLKWWQKPDPWIDSQHGLAEHFGSPIAFDAAAAPALGRPHIIFFLRRE
jgi:hypothetical protein